MAGPNFDAPHSTTSLLVINTNQPNPAATVWAQVVPKAMADAAVRHINANVKTYTAFAVDAFGHVNTGAP